MFSCTPPGLVHAIDTGLVMNVKDSINPFAVLQDSKDLVEQKLQCGPLESVALSTNDGIPTKTRHRPLIEAQSSSHEGFAGLNGCVCKKINSTVDLNITPESINRLTSKYSLANPIHVEPTSVSPRGPPDGDQLGRVQEAIGKGLLPRGSDDLSLDNCPMKESSMS
ncbi:hypothetical protein Nepgr_016466 [Nepenthes gracilis]|uniref:Uncharacterized protein n=1 Tax=Nepenthes gracilis TaxID=150966 RepID=A0AAD3XSJ1_NEPGR|nr:hypothetical protein Nepgr_016466 [Nepenthes gracilis]